MNKKIILAIIIVIILAVIIYQFALKKEESTFTLTEVVRGNVSQEVSETGQVNKGEEINLSFRNSGRIAKIYVEVGKNVKEWEILARLETDELQIKLQEAKSVLAIAKKNLDILFAGASSEEIKIAQTKVDNNQIALDTAKQDLKDTYEDALNTLDDSYLKAYNAQNKVNSIQRTYFTENDQEGVKVKENKAKIETAVSLAKTYLDTAKADSKNENIDTALLELKESLNDIYEALEIIREVCEEPNYRNIVSSTDKTSLDTQKTNVNTALTDLVDSQQSIVSENLSINSAEGKLQTAKDELALLTAFPRQVDIDLYQAKIDQAQAQVNLLENQIQEAYLRSPVKGQIIEIKKRVGEIVQPSSQDVSIILLPAAPFEIEVDIYEEDVVKMDIGNLVDIFLVAFPNQDFKGKIISINPAEKLIEGVVYYEATIGSTSDSENWIPDKVKPGMTADLVIRTALRENVLVIPEDAIQKKDGKKIVEVFKNGDIKDREIEIGLQGSNYLVEITSGLEEGEEVILRQ